MTNNQKFEFALVEILTKLFATDAGYSFVAKRETPENMARLLTKGLPTQEASKDGQAVKAVCNQLKIKHTYKAIAEYLKE